MYKLYSMTRIFVLISSLAMATVANALTFSGLSDSPVHVPAESSSGLDAGIYVVPVTTGVSLQHTPATSPAAIRTYTFDNSGAAYAREIAYTVQGSDISIPLVDGDAGYIIEDGTTRTCLWVTDYSRHRLTLTAIEPDMSEDGCARTALHFEGDAHEIPYYSLTGRRLTLSRQLELHYNTLSFDSETFVYTPVETTETLEYIGTTIHATAPLCGTTFELSGDRFCSAWGDGQTIVSTTMSPMAVAAQTRATQLTTAADNEQSTGVDGLGGSAPCTIEFEAAVTDAAVYTEWQISRTQDFDILENQYNQLSFEYTFRDQGTTYVRFVTDNADGTCNQTSDTYSVFIGESKLDIPNAFSPGASPGVNDEWKVSYKSLVKYECHIYNRWGTLLFASTNPTEGWDGRYRGKLVGAGVYFYVIKATGADGVKWDRAGDINIINHTSSRTSSSDDQE